MLLAYTFSERLLHRSHRWHHAPCQTGLQQGTQRTRYKCAAWGESTSSDEPASSLRSAACTVLNRVANPRLSKVLIVCQLLAAGSSASALQFTPPRPAPPHP